MAGGHGRRAREAGPECTAPGGAMVIVRAFSAGRRSCRAPCAVPRLMRLIGDADGGGGYASVPEAVFGL